MERPDPRHLAVWHEIFTIYPPWRFLRNGRADTRAWNLYADEAVDITSCSPALLSARVTGRTGNYRTGCSYDGDRLSFDCDCPSSARPCKHIGALAYTVLEDFEDLVDEYDDVYDPDDLFIPDGHHAGGITDLFGSADAGRGRPAVPGAPESSVEAVDSEEADDNIERLRPGAELGRTSVRRGAGPPHGGEQAPGADDRPIDEPIPDLGILLEPDGSLPAGGRQPAHSERNKRYRPVFEIVENHDFTHVGRQAIGSLHVRAALIYVKQDGNDGAMTQYSTGKPRLRAPARVELMYRYLATREGRSAPATVVLAGELEHMCERSGAEEHAPELYFEYEAGDRPRPAAPRAIERIALTWGDAGHDGTQPLIAPVLAAETGAAVGPSKRAADSGDSARYLLTPETAESVDADGRLLLVPLEDHGVLLFRFDDPPVIYALRRLISSPPPLTLDRAAEFASVCRAQLGSVLEIEEPPEEIELLTVVPQPVLSIEPERSGYGCKARLLFRYGDREVAHTNYIDLLPATAAPGDTGGADRQNRTDATGPDAPGIADAQADTDAPTGTDAAGSADPPTAWRYYRRLYDFEQHYLERGERLLAGTLSAAGEFTGHLFDAPLYVAPDELLVVLAAEAFDAGFELRYRGKRVRALAGTPTYRVTPAGEGWFEAEMGLRDGEQFVPIENPPHRGSVVTAGGTVYVFTGAEDLERFLFGGARVRFSEDDLATAALIEDLADDPKHDAFERLRVLRERLSTFEGLAPIEPPEGLRSTLRPYQRHGLSWLWFLHEYRLGGCLADDMGLGKTVQTLACLLTARERDRMDRALVVAPVSTLSNWKREIERFTPQLRPLIHAGPQRATDAAGLDGADIILVSYATLRMDITLFQSVPLDYLILDESQALKNPHSKTRAAVRRLDPAHRLALSGTPIENNTVELWSLLDLLVPGMLGRLTDFRRRYAKPIEENGDDDARGRLQRIVRPLLLRRRKREVAPELPEREERLEFAEPGAAQLRVYESLRLKFKKSIERQVERDGIDGARMHILEAMLRLRQAAILPGLVDPEYSRTPSAKLDHLEELLDTIEAEGNKALVFSQFVAVIDQVERRLGSGRTLLRIDGSTPQQRRAEAIDAFQNETGPALFLISLKAGGFGINLTAADYVILLDPWWNPAVESQAIDRAHRIGRDGTVIAYRLITAGTIEEKMLRLQERKRTLAESIIRSDAGGLAGLTADDLHWLFGE